MLEVASVLAGLGLFLSGLHLISGSLQALLGHKIRRLLRKVTDGYLKQALAGIGVGAVTQSTSGSAFICMSLVNAGAVQYEKVLTLLAWSSVGTSALVFLVAIDIRLAGLYLVALVGVAHLLKLDRYHGARHGVALLFAMGLLLFGLGMIKEGGQLLEGSSWAAEFIEFTSSISLFGFLVGMLITLLAQSASTVTIVAITLCLSGIISYDDAIVIVFGANIGSGLSLLFITSHLDGVQKQLAVYQFLVKTTGVIILMPLFLLYREAAIFASDDIMDPSRLALNISLIYLYLQVIGAICISGLNGYLQPWLVHTFPEPAEQVLARPKYIYPEAVEDTDSALLLVKREQDRLLIHLTDYLGLLRHGAGTAGTISAGSAMESMLPNGNMQADQDIARQIKEFMEEVVMQDRSMDMVAEMFALQNRNETVMALQGTLSSFMQVQWHDETRQNALSQAMIEALHLILTVLGDMLHGSEEDEVLMALTSDRGELMEKIRNSLLTGESAADYGIRQSLFVSTGYFERSLWLVRQIVVADRTLKPMLQDAPDLRDRRESVTV